MRRFPKISWLLIPVIVTLTISGSLVYNNKNSNAGSVNHESVDFNSVKRRAYTTPESAAMPLASFRHVTKSLTELGKMDDMNSHVLFLNHVPNCGGEILILLLQKLQGLNNYKHIRLKGGNKRKLNRLQQEAFVDEVYNTMREVAVPLSFDRHVYFVNFSSFDKQSPTYVNLIRDPVDMVISRATFNNKNGRKNYFIQCLKDKKRNCNFQDGQQYDLIIPYFCGHDSRCGLLNNEWAFQKAKLNVEKYYPVVGLLEELNSTFTVLESSVSYFFKGLYTHGSELLHKHNENRFKAKTRDPIIEKLLRKTLRKENEFYEWAKSRLLKQVMRLT